MFIEKTLYDYGRKAKESRLAGLVRAIGPGN